MHQLHALIPILHLVHSLLRLIFTSPMTFIGTKNDMDMFLSGRL